VIFELRSYVLMPGTLDETLRRFEAVLPHRLQFSRLAGLWCAESGDMDRIVHLWPYDSVQQRMDLRAAAAASGEWPPKIRQQMLEADSWIVVPPAGAPGLEPAALGNCYELCIDHYRPGGIEDMLPAWQDAGAARAGLGTLVASGRTEIGALYRWVHLWAYRDSRHRADAQAHLRAEGGWPPESGRDRLLRRQSVLMRPASFSPLR
jgi:NIPSNAP